MLVAELLSNERELEPLAEPGGARAEVLVPDHVEHRVRRLAENPGRDRVRQSEVEQAIELYREAGGTLPLQADAPARIVKARWLLEELRLSLFAQHIRTTEPASLQRIRKALA